MDLTKDRAKLKELYSPGADDFVFVDVPELPFATIDGQGPPDAAIKRLFTAIQPIRREARTRMGKQFVEAPLEMLHWADDPRDFAAGDRSRWKWRAMIVLPAWIDAATFADAAVQTGGSADAPRLEWFEEGRCAQILHVGASQDIPALLDRLYAGFLPEKAVEPAGPYHEIYLDDWSRVGPEKREMILRQPVRARR